MERGRVVLQSLARAAERLSITQDDSTVSIVFADSSSLRVPTDNSKVDWTWPPSFDTDVRAQWRDGALRLERKIEDGPTITETFVRAPGSTRLIITSAVENAFPRKLEYRRVYDADAADARVER